MEVIFTKSLLLPCVVDGGVSPEPLILLGLYRWRACMSGSNLSCFSLDGAAGATGRNIIPCNIALLINHTRRDKSLTNE